MDYPLAGGFSEYYVGVEYAPALWKDLQPSEFRVALLAAVSADLTQGCAAEALQNAVGSQLGALTRADIHILLAHDCAPIRLAAIRWASRLFGPGA